MPARQASMCMVGYHAKMVALPSRRATYAEYLELEKTSETKHEYVNGEIFAMAGGTIEHGRLASRLAYLLQRSFEGRACETLGSDVRVRIEATGRATYPDLSVVCGEARHGSDDPDALTNPTVLVEVLLVTTETGDRTDKWAHYRRIPSLQCYVLVSQHERRVETFRRDGRRWTYEELGSGETVTVAGVDVTFAVDDLYATALST
jgi:Uma2 family endonuclease